MAGEQRILAVLFLLLVAPAGSRPDSILMVRLRDIQLALHRPKEGPVQLIIYLNLVNTKSYRGSKGTYVSSALVTGLANPHAAKHSSCPR